MGEIRDPIGIARHVVVWSYVWMVSEILNGLIGLTMLFAPEQIGGSPTIASARNSHAVISDIVPTLFPILNFGILLVCVVLASIWLYRMTAAKRALGDGTVISPGWAIGWFFIPIANLFRPFEAIKEAWQVCENPEAWWHMPTPDMLRWRWGLWIIINMVENLSSRIANSSSQGVAALSILSALLSIPLTILWTRIVRHISSAESRLLSAVVFH